MTEKPQKKELVLLGDAAVGKTSLAASLCGKSFDSSNKMTMGIEVSFLDTDNEIQMIDYGGQQIYQEKYKDKVGRLDNAVVLVVVNTCSNDPIQSIDYWGSVLDGKEGIIKHLVFTKSDIAIKTINDEFVKEKYGFIGIHDTSAKIAKGIQELREAINGSFKLLGSDPDESQDPINIIVHAMAKQLCKLIAMQPGVLRTIEWRDLERIIATALEGLGFDVELTPPAKDGGKDVIAKCVVSGEKKIFYIEIKHWQKGGRPGFQHVSDFIQINANDETSGGLFISSSGYANSVYDQINEIVRQNVRLGDQEKIVSLCQRYVRKNGIWRQSTPLPDLLYEDTIH